MIFRGASQRGKWGVIPRSRSASLCEGRVRVRSRERCSGWMVCRTSRSLACTAERCCWLPYGVRHTPVRSLRLPGVDATLVTRVRVVDRQERQRLVFRANDNLVRRVIYLTLADVARDVAGESQRWCRRTVAGTYPAFRCRNLRLNAVFAAGRWMNEPFFINISDISNKWRQVGDGRMVLRQARLVEQTRVNDPHYVQTLTGI